MVRNRFRELAPKVGGDKEGDHATQCSPLLTLWRCIGSTFNLLERGSFGKFGNKW